MKRVVDKVCTTAAWAALVGIAAVPGAVSAAAPQPVRLTLADAIAAALENNESVVVERAGLDAAEAGILAAEGAYDPLLAGSVGYVEATQPVNSAFSGAPEGEPAPTDESLETTAELRSLLTTGAEVSLYANSSRAETNGAFGLLSPAYGSQLGVELRQPLLRDRFVDAARLGLRVAAADRSRAAASLEREVRDTVASVEFAYWSLLAARREVEVRRDNVELASEQLDETVIRIENGVAPETERSQPQAELERRRGDLLAAEEAVERADNRLKLLILGDEDGDYWLRPVEPVDELPGADEQVELAATMERALEERVELQLAHAALAQREAETEFALDRTRPALDLVVSYDRYGLTGSANPNGGSVPGLPTDVPPELEGSWGSSLEALADGDFDRSRVALALELPLRNRTARGEAEIARAFELQAEAQVRSVRKAIRAEVLDAVAALDTARARIDAARAAKEAAEVQLSAERDRFEAGLSTNFLVLTRQNDLAEARLTEIAAHADYQRARVEVARVQGTLLAERSIQIEAP